MAVSSSSALMIVLFRSSASGAGSTAIGGATGALTVSCLAGSTGEDAGSGNFSESFNVDSGKGLGWRSGRGPPFALRTGLGGLASLGRRCIATRRNALACPANDAVNDVGKALLVGVRQILSGQFVDILLSVVGQDGGYPREIGIAFDKLSPCLPIIGNRRWACRASGVRENDRHRFRRPGGGADGLHPAGARLSVRDGSLACRLFSATSSDSRPMPISRKPTVAHTSVAQSRAPAINNIHPATRTNWPSLHDSGPNSINKHERQLSTLPAGCATQDCRHIR